MIATPRSPKPYRPRKRARSILDTAPFAGTLARLDAAEVLGRPHLDSAIASLADRAWTVADYRVRAYGRAYIRTLDAYAHAPVPPSATIPTLWRLTLAEAADIGRILRAAWEAELREEPHGN